MKDWIILSEEISNPDYGSYPGTKKVEDNMKNGFVLIDKPQGPTSSTVVAWIKEIFGVNKAGHSGTLDPHTSGVLPILLGKATRLMPALKNLDKEYVAVMKLHNNVSDEKLEKACKKFQGNITQRPPVRSAVKRVHRKRRVNSIDILDRQEKYVVIKVSCEAGTYIRKLIHQIGELIGGAHMTELRRTKVGVFTEDNCIKIHDLKDDVIFHEQKKENSLDEKVQPPEMAVNHIKKIVVKDSAIFSLLNGSPLYGKGILRLEKSIKENDLVAVLSGKGELVCIAVAKIDTDQMKNRNLCLRPDRVLMKKGTYPKFK